MKKQKNNRERWRGKTWNRVNRGIRINRMEPQKSAQNMFLWNKIFSVTQNKSYSSFPPTYMLKFIRVFLLCEIALFHVLLLYRQHQRIFLKNPTSHTSKRGTSIFMKSSKQHHSHNILKHSFNKLKLTNCAKI